MNRRSFFAAIGAALMGALLPHKATTLEPTPHSICGAKVSHGQRRCRHHGGEAPPVTQTEPDRRTATIVIQGGTLDMHDPRTARIFYKALRDLYRLQRPGA